MPRPQHRTIKGSGYLHTRDEIQPSRGDAWDYIHVGAGMATLGLGKILTAIEMGFVMYPFRAAAMQLWVERFVETNSLNNENRLRIFW